MSRPTPEWYELTQQVTRLRLDLLDSLNQIESLKFLCWLLGGVAVIFIILFLAVVFR